MARAKRAARRTALLAEALGNKARRRESEIWATPGLGAFLLHESPPAATTRLLAFVDEHRDHFVDFGAVDTYLSEPQRSPERLELVLTFDDGLKSNLEIARALADRQLSACFYVVTDGIGLSPTEADVFFRRRPMEQREYQVSEPTLSWGDLEQMRQWGHVIGSHGRAHVPMAGLSAAEVEDQIKGSIEMLRARLGEAHHLAWPFGGLHHAPVTDVVRWCDELDVVAASGVRGLNFVPRGAQPRYLLRDAIDVAWVATDFASFFGRHSRASRTSQSGVN